MLERLRPGISSALVSYVIRNSDGKLRQCLLTVVRGVLGYYGRATPLGARLAKQLDVETRAQLTGCGHRGQSGQVLQVTWHMQPDVHCQCHHRCCAQQQA